MNQYRVTPISSDTPITIRIPEEILKDLVLRSEENGSDIEVEFAIRLARTLERDYEMIDQDNALAVAAFTEITKVTKRKTKSGGI